MRNRASAPFANHRRPGGLRRARLLALLLAAPLLLVGDALARQAQQQTQQPPPQPAQQPSQLPQLKHAEQPPESPSKISSETKLVTVYATVRDKKGKIVASLNKEDFALDEDGRPQTISNFVRDTDVPLTLGLLVDTSYSQRGALDDERKASYTFLDHMLGDKDRAFVIHFDHEVELLQDLTPLRPKLQAALQLLDAAPRDTADDDQDSGQRHAGTLLYDAIYLASDDLMKKQQGRKALFVLSDGVDRGSKKSLEDAVEAAQRADTSVYSILFASGEEERSRETASHARGWGMGGGGRAEAVVRAAEPAGRAEGADQAGVEVVKAADVAGIAIPRKATRTARRSSAKSPRKRAGACLRSRRKCRSTRSTRRSKRNYAISTASAIHRTPPIPARAITRFISPRTTKT